MSNNAHQATDGCLRRQTGHMGKRSPARPHGSLASSFLGQLQLIRTLELLVSERCAEKLVNSPHHPSMVARAEDGEDYGVEGRGGDKICYRYPLI